MSIALPAEPARRTAGIDLSWPILIAFAVILCGLIVLPMSWLIYFSVTDRTGALTLDNFVRLVTDPTFIDPLITTVIIATTSSIACCTRNGMTPRVGNRTRTVRVAPKPVRSITSPTP